MRKVIYLLGTLTLVLIAGIVGVLVYFSQVGPGLDAESKAYADETVVAITQNWAINELRNRATPQFMAVTKPEDLRNLFEIFSRLGPLQEYGGAAGEANIAITAQSGKVISAQYIAQGRYKNGTATIRLFLLKSDDRWQVHGFHVNSPEMINLTVGRPS
jgi:hypothetical protein